MKHLIVALFAAASLFSVAPVSAIAGTDLAAVCADTALDAWKRPGGFCDQIQNNNTLVTPGGGDPALCAPVVGMLPQKGERVRVASAPTCCGTPIRFEFDSKTQRVIVAYYDPCNPCGYGMLDELADPDARDRVVLVAC